MSIEQEKMIVEALPSLYPLKDYEEDAIRVVLDAIPHWIPVTERLPNKEEKSYWVCLEGGGQCQCRWTNDVYGLGANEWSKWGWKKVDLPHFSKVVAYMPLPEPYKGVTE
jgi:Protein of unknown function (DUF551).